MGYLDDEGRFRIEEDGSVSLLHNGKMLKVKHAQPAKGDTGETKGFGYPWFWDVLFENGTRAEISGLIMRSALICRMYECPMSVLGVEPESPFP